MKTEDIILIENNAGGENAVVNPDNDQDKQESRINSYEGMFKHLNGTSKIRKFIADSRKPQ